MPDTELYADDRTLAQECGHRFDVVRKDGRGTRWIGIAHTIADLHDAMIQARDTKAYETGVLVFGLIAAGSRVIAILLRRILTIGQRRVRLRPGFSVHQSAAH
jgi:hypothetical protein